MLYSRKQEKNMQHHSRALLALILAPFVFSFAFALDIYVPVVPHMRAVFHASQFMVQMTLSLFLLGLGLGQLLMGPLADKYGRWKVLFISALLFSLTSLICALSNSIITMLISRVFCGVGACGLLIVSFAIVRDLYSGDESAQLYSWLNAAIGVSPTFAPIIGSLLAAVWGWRAVFWFLVLMGIVVAILICAFVRETLPVSKRVPVDRQVFKRYLTLYSHRTFIKYTLFASFGVATCFSFFSVSPFIIINLLHVPEIHFGLYFAVFGVVLIIGGILAGKLNVTIGLDKTINIGLSLLMLGGVLMLATNLLIGLHLWSFLITMAIACCGAVFCIGAGAAGAMEPFPNIAATAAAAFQAGEFLIAALIGTILMHFPVTSSISYAITLIIISLLGVSVKYLTK
jgi:Bcr/CflA subfamily drug resistance transporter